MSDGLNRNQQDISGQEENQAASQDSEAACELTGVEIFLGMWRSIGEQFIEYLTPSEIEKLFKAVNEAKVGEIKFTLYFREDLTDSLSWDYEFDIEDAATSETDIELLDDRESYAEGDSDESD